MAERGEMNPDEVEPEKAGRDDTEIDELDRLAEVFRQQLTACLEECAQGRRGLFLDLEQDATGQEGWPAAARTGAGSAGCVCAGGAALRAVR